MGILAMDCRIGCGACCIAPSIRGPIPGMPGGKAAGVRCVHLTEGFACGLWGDPRRPEICSRFLPEPAMCGNSREDALNHLNRLEILTGPAQF